MQSVHKGPELEAWHRQSMAWTPQNLPTWLTLGLSCLLQMALNLSQVLTRLSPSFLRFLCHQTSWSCEAIGLEYIF